MGVFGPIATLPSLLPALFQLTGQAVPKQFSDTMQPTMDVLEALAASNCLEIITPAAQLVSSVGIVKPPELIVPAQEAWLVHGASLRAGSIAGETIRASLHVGRSTVAGQVPARRFPVGTSSLTDAIGVGICTSAIDVPWLILFGSDYIGCEVEKITTAGTISLQFAAQVFRFTS